LRPLIERAIAIDENSSETNTSRALLITLYDWQHRESLKYYEAAVAADPRYAFAYHLKSAVCAVLGEHEQAIAEENNLAETAYYVRENGRYRLARVYNGENWNPQTRAPLTQPGVNVVAGEYLLGVNGRNLTATDNLFSFFESTAGKSVVIRVGPNPDGSGSREVTVVPVPNEFGLRNLAWIEDNRRKVDQMSGGKLAYVYLPDTAGGGYTNFNRYYFAQIDKDGAVIDERFNGGGSAADYIVDFLRKPIMSYWAVREGQEATTPFGVIPGPKVMIVNTVSVITSSINEKPLCCCIASTVSYSQKGTKSTNRIA